MLAVYVSQRLKQLKIFQMSAYPDVKISLSVIQEHLTVITELSKQMAVIIQYESHEEEPRSKNYDRIMQQLNLGLEKMEDDSPIKDAVSELKQYVKENREAYIVGKSPVKQHPAVEKELAEEAGIMGANQINKNIIPPGGQTPPSNRSAATSTRPRPTVHAHSDLQARPPVKLATHSDTPGGRLFTRPRPNQGLSLSNQGIVLDRLDLSENDFSVLGLGRKAK